MKRSVKVFAAGVGMVWGLLGLNGVTQAQITITTCEELQAMKDNLSADYVLGNDIDCVNSDKWNGGAGFLPIGSGNFTDDFTGSLDGQGHTIKRLTVNGNVPVGDISKFSQKGLFGRTTDVEIKNLTLEDIHVSGGVYEVAGVVGLAKNTKLTNVHVTSSPRRGSVIVGSNEQVGGRSKVAGLVAVSVDKDVVIDDCSAHARLKGYDIVGGLVGINRGTVKNSSSHGAVIGDTAISNLNIGPIVGLNENFQPSTQNPLVLSVYSTAEVFLGQAGQAVYRK